MTYSSSFQDSMIQIGDTWVRASQIETVKGEPYTRVNASTIEVVTVRLISGRTIEKRIDPGGAKNIARKAVGLP